MCAETRWDRGRPFQARDPLATVAQRLLSLSFAQTVSINQEGGLKVHISQEANGKEETLSTLRKAAEALGGEGWCESERVNVKEAAASFPPAVSCEAAATGLKKRKKEHTNRSLPPEWRQFWSKSKLRPYFQHKATKRVVWEVPDSEWEPGEMDCVCNKCYTARTVSSGEASSLDGPFSPAKDARAQVFSRLEQQLESPQGHTLASSQQLEPRSEQNGAKRQRVEEDMADSRATLITNAAKVCTDEIFSQDARTNQRDAPFADADSAPDLPDGHVMSNGAKLLAAYVAAAGELTANGEARCEEYSGEDHVQLVPFSCESPVEARAISDSFRREFTEDLQPISGAGMVQTDGEDSNDCRDSHDNTPDTPLDYDSAPDTPLTSVSQAQHLGAFVAAAATEAHAARGATAHERNLYQPERRETSEDDVPFVPFRCESTFDARAHIDKVNHHQSDPPAPAYNKSAQDDPPAKTPPTVRRRSSRRNSLQPAATLQVFHVSHGSILPAERALVSAKILVFEGKTSVLGEVSVAAEKKEQESAEQARPWLEEEAEANLKKMEVAEAERARLAEDRFKTDEEGRLRRRLQREKETATKTQTFAEEVVERARFEEKSFKKEEEERLRLEEEARVKEEEEVRMRKEREERLQREEQRLQKEDKERMEREEEERLQRKKEAKTKKKMEECDVASALSEAGPSKDTAPDVGSRMDNVSVRAAKAEIFPSVDVTDKGSVVMTPGINPHPSATHVAEDCMRSIAGSSCGAVTLRTPPCGLVKEGDTILGGVTAGSLARDGYLKQSFGKSTTPKNPAARDRLVAACAKLFRHRALSDPTLPHAHAHALLATFFSAQEEEEREEKEKRGGGGCKKSAPRQRGGAGKDSLACKTEEEEQRQKGLPFEHANERKDELKRERDGEREIAREREERERGGEKNTPAVAHDQEMVKEENTKGPDGDEVSRLDIKDKKELDTAVCEGINSQT